MSALGRRAEAATSLRADSDEKLPW
jgi:hypothetical protein